MSRQALRRTCRPQPRRSPASSALDLHDVIDSVKAKLEKQKTAAVLGALGIVASGLTAVGTRLGLITQMRIDACLSMQTSFSCFCRAWICRRHGQDRNLLAWQLSGNHLHRCLLVMCKHALSMEKSALQHIYCQHSRHLYISLSLYCCSLEAVAPGLCYFSVHSGRRTDFMACSQLPLHASAVTA